MISYKGKLGATAALPIMASMLAALDIAGLTSEVAALLQATVTFTPPSILGIGLVIDAVLGAIMAGFQPPAFDFKANLLVKYGLLKARLELILELQSMLLSGSVRVYEYEGAAGSFAGELGARIDGADVDGGVAPTQDTFAVVLLAEGGTSGATLLKALRGET